MCTLALIRRRIEGFPLVVAANRDEALDRPATGPRLWDDPVPFVAGRDERAGGTWLGINAHGVVVGLTNHWSGRPPDPDLASRGGIVRDLLRHRDLDELRRALAALDPRATNPYLLLAAHREGEALWAASVEELQPHAIDAPVFALGNQLPHEDGGGRVRRLADGVASLDGARPGTVPGPLVARLRHHLSGHSPDRGPADSVCVHTDRGYGTVSSTILLLADDPAHDELHHAPGPPCRTPFEDHGSVLRSLPRP